MKCFYHSADLDGKCSGAIVKMFNPECEMIGINYGDTFPWESISPGERVFLVDFTLQPFDDMIRLNQLCNGQLNWIDHHKTAIEEASKHSFIVAGGIQSLQIGQAACELTWQALSKNPMPRAVFLLGRYDVWDHHNHPGSLEFQYGMRAYDARPECTGFWKGIFFSDIENDIDLGRQLLAFEKRNNEMYVKSCAFEVEFDGLRCIAVNKGLTNSLLFESVYDPEKHDAMLSFCRRPGKWTVSIYATKPEVDASAICKARGGGGHKGAAGFQCETLPFGFPTSEDKTTALTCVYCGMAYPEGTPPHGSQILTDHIKVCEKHPLRAAEATIEKLRVALIGLVGVEGKAELETMEAMVRLADVPARDKAVTIDAIHALIDVA